MAVLQPDRFAETQRPKPGLRNFSGAARVLQGTTIGIIGLIELIELNGLTGLIGPMALWSIGHGVLR